LMRRLCATGLTRLRRGPSAVRLRSQRQPEVYTHDAYTHSHTHTHTHTNSLTHSLSLSHTHTHDKVGQMPMKRVSDQRGMRKVTSECPEALVASTAATSK